ncbi:transglutaminase-like cysteine peptidase [Chthonobacter rhizosphaerae]|uniref:transglutaminase-like cysteine peptidase n=1 Tax=Chthonobacter rhizosphaerae TaxID=2735553 RepID=UPI0015EF8734|nr:transglutaminase-like cysteine peptidase [Chthonobacter rhizosphaerae]
MVRKRVWTTLVLIALGVLADRASAGFVPSDEASVELPLAIRLTEAEPASEPFGHSMFCRRVPSLCTVRPGQRPADADGALVLDHPAMDMISRVHRVVNRAIRPQAERVGAPDHWKVGGVSGDCEDYALAKRELLVRLGVPSRALRLATGHLRNGEYHAVLLVRTDRGDLVLDNLNRDVRAAERSGLRFDMIQDGDDPRVFRRVRPAAEARALGV